jgi:predicted aminopeptidase
MAPGRVLMLTRRVCVAPLTVPAVGAVMLLVLGLVTGCSSVGYYGQAVRGHLEVMGKRERIAVLLEDPATDAALAASLAGVLAIRDFASAELGLPDNDSYRTYTDLGRPYVVWNVVAAPQFSLSPEQWCFPFVGCLTYKGYFAEARAEREAQDLRERGYDVVVGGVAAYSTLGRFDDPFLNTMIGYTPARTASLIFHELAHQFLYVKGDTAFNEAFASFVAEEGVRRWLAQRGDAQEAAAWRARERRRQQFTALVLDGRSRLQALYAREDLDDAARLEAKRAELSALQQRYATLRDTAWEGYDGYDRWFAEVNNARLASVATYRRLVPAFAALLAQQDGDFAAFLAASEALAALPAPERTQRLEALLAVSAQAPGRSRRNASSSSSSALRR